VRQKLFNFAAAASLLLWISITAFRFLLPAGGLLMARYGSNDARVLRIGPQGLPDVSQYQSLHDPTGRVIPLLNGPPRVSPQTFIYENRVSGGQSFRVLGLYTYWGRYNHRNGPCDYFVLTVDHAAVQLLTSLLPMLWVAVWIIRSRLAKSCRRWALPSLLVQPDRQHQRLVP
jgi:hypothetical protein